MPPNSTATEEHDVASNSTAAELVQEGHVVDGQRLVEVQLHPRGGVSGELGGVEDRLVRRQVREPQERCDLVVRQVRRRSRGRRPGHRQRSPSCCRRCDARSGTPADSCRLVSVSIRHPSADS